MNDNQPFAGSNAEADKAVADLCGYFGMPGVLRAMIRELGALHDKWTDADMRRECQRRATILHDTLRQFGSGE